MATAKTIHNSGSLVKHKNEGMWEKAICYLESELRRTQSRKRAGELEAAIRTFKANLARGMPWPDESATQS
jgi:hypothetical protein